jgi:hypothetical protein
VPKLINGIYDPHWADGLEAVRALGRIGPAAKQAIPELEKVTKVKPKEVEVFNGHDAEFAAAAAEALKRIGTEEASKPADAKGQP